MADMQLIVSEIEKVAIDIYCGCYLTPPSLCGGGDGDECCFATALVIPKDLWEDGFTAWCPECGSELADGYGIEETPSGD